MATDKSGMASKPKIVRIKDLKQGKTVFVPEFQLGPVKPIPGFESDTIGIAPTKLVIREYLVKSVTKDKVVLYKNGGYETREAILLAVSAYTTRRAAYRKLQSISKQTGYSL